MHSHTAVSGAQYEAVRVSVVVLTAAAVAVNVCQSGGVGEGLGYDEA